jgi:hypothetical protein
VIEHVDEIVEHTQRVDDGHVGGPLIGKLVHQLVELECDVFAFVLASMFHEV